VLGYRRSALALERSGPAGIAIASDPKASAVQVAPKSRTAHSLLTRAVQLFCVLPCVTVTRPALPYARLGRSATIIWVRFSLRSKSSAIRAYCSAILLRAKLVMSSWPQLASSEYFLASSR
jgi:hypothetical protein